MEDDPRVLDYLHELQTRQAIPASADVAVHRCDAIELLAWGSNDEGGGLATSQTAFALGVSIFDAAIAKLGATAEYKRDLELAAAALWLAYKLEEPMTRPANEVVVAVEYNILIDSKTLKAREVEICEALGHNLNFVHIETWLSAMLRYAAPSPQDRVHQLCRIHTDVVLLSPLVAREPPSVVAAAILAVAHAACQRKLLWTPALAAIARAPWTRIALVMHWVVAALLRPQPPDSILLFNNDGRRLVLLPPGLDASAAETWVRLPKSHDRDTILR